MAIIPNNLLNPHQLFGYTPEPDDEIDFFAENNDETNLFHNILALMIDTEQEPGKYQDERLAIGSTPFNRNIGRYSYNVGQYTDIVNQIQNPELQRIARQIFGEGQYSKFNKGNLRKRILSENFGENISPEALNIAKNLTSHYLETNSTPFPGLTHFVHTDPLDQDYRQSNHPLPTWSGGHPSSAANGVHLPFDPRLAYSDGTFSDDFLPFYQRSQVVPEGHEDYLIDNLLDSRYAESIYGNASQFKNLPEQWVDALDLYESQQDPTPQDPVTRDQFADASPGSSLQNWTRTLLQSQVPSGIIQGLLGRAQNAYASTGKLFSENPLNSLNIPGVNNFLQRTLSPNTSGQQRLSYGEGGPQIDQSQTLADKPNLLRVLTHLGRVRAAGEGGSPVPLAQGVLMNQQPNVGQRTNLNMTPEMQSYIRDEQQKMIRGEPSVLGTLNPRIRKRLQRNRF